MSTPVLRLGDRERTLPALEASLAVGSTIRLSLEAGPLRLGLLIEPAEAKALLAGGPAFPARPGEDPVFLEGEGILNLREARLVPEGEGRFLLEAAGTSGWGASERAWTVRNGGRVDRLDVEAKTEKGARIRLAEILPAPSPEDWHVEGFPVPELGQYRLEVDRLAADVEVDRRVD